LNYIEVESCDLYGKTDEGEFTIKNYASKPVTDCESMHQVDISKDDKYYRETTEYQTCIDEANADYDRCDAYLVEISKEESDELVSQGHPQITDNGKYYKQGPNYQNCLDEEQAQRDACDQYLQEVPESDLEKNPNNGAMLEQECTLNFTIPSDNKTEDNKSEDKSSTDTKSVRILNVNIPKIVLYVSIPVGIGGIGAASAFTFFFLKKRKSKLTNQQETVKNAL
jgi:hypothetical protein